MRKLQCTFQHCLRYFWSELGHPPSISSHQPRAACGQGAVVTGRACQDVIGMFSKLHLQMILKTIPGVRTTKKGLGEDYVKKTGDTKWPGINENSRKMTSAASHVDNLSWMASSLVKFVSSCQHLQSRGSTFQSIHGVRFSSPTGPVSKPKDKPAVSLPEMSMEVEES